ncbi:MAG: hypothetical protein ACQEXC_10585 [Pseudomonadota bacterium]
MSMERVRQHLDEQNIKYSILQHSPAYTAQEVAESVHVTGRHFQLSYGDFQRLVDPIEVAL